MRGTLPIFFACVLIVQASPISARNTEALRERFQRTPLGTEIEVELRNGETVTGQLAVIAENLFILSITPAEQTRRRLGLQDGSLLNRRISFDEVNSVRGVKKQWDVAHTFSELQGKIKAGDTVRVTRSSGEVIKRRIQGFSSDGTILRLRSGVRGRTLLERYDDESLDLTEADIQRIELEVRDRLWDGPLYGFLIGLGIAVPFYNTEVFVPALVEFGGIGAGVGFLADISRGRERQLVFSAEQQTSSLRFTLHPILTKDRKGAALSFSW